jgi:SAM-dependent methyltransferase
MTVPPGINPDVPSVARMYDYYLGGKDNFASDRAAAEQIIELGRKMGSDGREMARSNRAFLGRAVRLIAESGVRQFIDLGAGLPTQDNVHQVAGRYAPGSRVVYVDNDPTVLVHARALLARESNVLAMEGDVRDVGTILDDPRVRAHIDFTQPFAVLLVAVLHFVPDDAEAARITATVRDRLGPGGHLVLSHIYRGNATDDATRQGDQIYSATNTGALVGRGYDQIGSFFDGLELLGPGLAPVADWRADAPADGSYDLVKAGILGGVGRSVE